MRCLIFGGSGFIGSHVAQALRADGAEVVVADLNAPADPVPGAHFVRCDVRRPITIDPGTGFDKVFNFAAIHRTPGHEPHEYYETNVLGAQHITDWCDVNEQRSLIFTSSISVYGPSEVPKSENCELTPNGDYGRSKQLAEAIHQHWGELSSENRLTISRPAVVFGRGEHGNFTRLAHALARGRFLYAGRTDVVKACGYVEDLVDAMLYVEGLGKRETIFNFCYERPYTIEQICQAFQAVAGYNLPRMLPRPLLKTAMATLRVVNPNNRGPIVAARIAKLTMSTNIEPAFLRENGYTWPTDLEGGLRAWLASTGTGTFE